ncbi:molybdopterin-dependent oxidoreductase [Candidatus Methylocalor cossyra]|uniref:Nitrate reductase n=1 Tax=Candidatus Methylocalor cossyra TaxID=3108543 RepID=A0ABM9NM21_9GAMM
MNDAAPTIRTTCPYCGVGCGVIATPSGPFSATLQGDPHHPANYGQLCSKGSALGDTLGLETRLLYPMIGTRRVSWDEALDAVARGFRAIIDAHGPDAVAFYVSGQLLTEDYYVANKLMKGFIGSGNIDTNSRLCMSSTVAGQQRAFGEDLVPGCYEDLELAELVVLVGSNTAWCHPVLFQRLLKARRGDPARRLVAIDPRRTATAQLCDLHLAIRPGTDVVLFNGLLDYLRRHDRLDFAFLEQHTQGYAEALRLARATAPSLPAVAETCGVPEQDLATFYHWFAVTEKTVTAWSQGVNQSASGTDKVNAILNVHLATGRLGRPGMGPLSLTGQPNAMGGREVGGLANQLAAHIGFDDPAGRALVREFWQAPRLAERPGLKAVELFQAIGEGRVKAVWIMGTNPAVSLPDTNAVRRALAACPWVVVSDCEAHTDLGPYAHVRLPALAWGEKDGTVTNSERRISRQRPFLAAPGEARPDWWIITQVARRLGFREGFPYESPQQIFVEHARLSGFRNRGQRWFDISALADLDQAGYDALQPVQWPVNAAHPAGTARLFAAGGFAFPDRRARLVGLEPRPAADGPDAAYPWVLNTGRIRDQWHTMTRTGKAPRLTQHRPEPYAELHPTDAARLGLADGALVRLVSRHGEALARARVTADQQPGAVFMPMHWTDQFARRGLVNALVHPVTDPCSGEPDFKYTPVRVEPYRPAWQGFLLTREPLDPPDCDYRVVVRGQDHWLYRLAGTRAMANWAAYARALLTPAARSGAQGWGGDEWLELVDAPQGRYRCALLRDGRLAACLLVEAARPLPAPDWLAGLFAEGRLDDSLRRRLLSGRPASPREAPGDLVCYCHGIGLNTLKRAIRDQDLRTPEAIGAVLGAGTQCGSCLPELKALLEAFSQGG